MFKKIIMYFIVILFFSNCGNNKVSKSDIDNFVLKYQYEDFSYFKNYKIIIRQKTFSETIYMIGDSNSNIDSVFFFVFVNNYTDEVSKIETGTSFESISSKKLNEDKIKKMISKYKKYDFPYLCVNYDNSVSINPFYMDMKPFFLRLNIKSNDKLTKKNFTLFKHYKNNWYIKE